MDNGDKVFGEPYSLKAYVNYRQKIMLENEGTIYENYTYIILDGKDVQFNTIHNEDEIVLPQQPRVPIKSVKTYQGLPDGTQNVELIV